MGKKNVVVSEAPKQEEEASCTHHWVIDSPTGPTSVGVCKHCGTKREFTNFAFYSPWEDEVKLGMERRNSWKRNGSRSPDDLSDSIED